MNNQSVYIYIKFENQDSYQNQNQNQIRNPHLDSTLVQ